MKRDLYAEVSARIITELERGAAPWVKPWSATAGANTPCNAVTNRPYSGCNVILLWLARDRGWPTPRFLTFKQAIEAGGNVRKGEHGTKVIFVKQLQVKEGEGDEADTRLVPMLREYTCFQRRPMRQPARIASKPESRCVFAIQTRAIHWPMIFCVQLAPTFGRAMVKHTMRPAGISFPCRHSRRSKVRTSSTTLLGTNWSIGRGAQVAP